MDFYYIESIVILSCIIVDGLFKIFFLIWSLKFFLLGDLVLIENQLILISYKSVRLKDEGM